MLWGIKPFPPAFNAADFGARLAGITTAKEEVAHPRPTGAGNALGWQLAQGRAQFQPLVFPGRVGHRLPGSLAICSSAAAEQIQRELQICNDLNIPALAHL